MVDSRCLFVELELVFELVLIMNVPKVFIYIQHFSSAKYYDSDLIQLEEHQEEKNARESDGL